jgi:hypothetical protein
MLEGVTKQKLARSWHYRTSAGPAKAFVSKLAVCDKEKIPKCSKVFAPATHQTTNGP